MKNFFHDLKLTDPNKIILIQKVKTLFQHSIAAHGWLHISEVQVMSYKIANQMASEPKTSVNFDAVELIALMHDVGDSKLKQSQHNQSTIIRNFLKEFDFLTDAEKNNIASEASKISYSKKLIPETLEGQIVQDADRLMALGQVGLKRVYAYGRSLGRKDFDPKEIIIIKNQKTQELEYNATAISSLAHFYHKLLKIYNLLNTQAAKTIGQEKHLTIYNHVKQVLDKNKHKYQQADNLDQYHLLLEKLQEYRLKK